MEKIDVGLIGKKIDGNLILNTYKYNGFLITETESVFTITSNLIKDKTIKIPRKFYDTIIEHRGEEGFDFLLGMYHEKYINEFRKRYEKYEQSKSLN